MDNRNVTRRRRQNQSSPLVDDDDFIQGRELLLDDLNDSQDSQQTQEVYPINTISNKNKPWVNKEMSPIPDYPEQIIDINAEGFDPFLIDNQKILDYIKEDRKENIVILYNGKYYLTTRTIIEQQKDEALVYECIKGDIKRYENVVINLPLYNLKKIGINISSDNAVGIEPEYIYMDGIDVMLSSPDDYQWPFYSIIPLHDKMLVSVISKSEALKIGTNLGSGYGALHCQAGQGGLAGILVKAYPNERFLGGRKKRKTLKKKRTGIKRTVKKRTANKRKAKK